jgi:hypothetical protein
MKLSPAEHGSLIKQRLSEGASYRTIAGELGCDHTTVATFVKVNFPNLRRKARGRSPIKLGEVDETELLKAELADARRDANKRRNIDVQAERLVQEIRQQVKPADVRFEAPEDAEGTGSTHMQVLLLSDLHIGEVVEPEAVNGLNEYNWETFQKRMAGVREALISFQNNRPYPIDEMVIALLGDNVSGNHHEELAVTNEFPITEQCYRGGVYLGKWIESLVPDFPLIRVDGVGGNHARTKKAPASKQVFDSFDWLGYQYVDQYLKNYDTIETNFPRAGMLVTEVAGRNMLLWHGDGVRSTMPGVPWGGVIRRVNEMKKQYSEAGMRIDYVSLGHFHQANVVQGNVFMNGSLMGLNEYGLKNFGSGEKPTQLLLTFNRDKKRLTDVSFITP